MYGFALQSNRLNKVERIEWVGQARVLSEATQEVEGAWRIREREAGGYGDCRCGEIRELFMQTVRVLTN